MSAPPTATPSTSTYRPGGLQNATAFREVVINKSASDGDIATSITLSSGTTVPTHTRPDGSIYWNTSTGDRYVRASGVWAVDSAGGLELVTEPGAGMVAGNLVYISGNDGTDPEVTLATNTDLDTRSTLVLLEDIATGAVGAAAGIAEVGGLNTLAGSVGDKVYLDTAGGWTLVAPTGATDIVQEVGVIKVDSATVGVILFYPGYTKLQGIEVSDLMGVTATAAELNYNDLTGAVGTVEASKAVVVDANKDITEFRNIGAALLTRDSNNLNISTTTTGSVEVDGIDGVAVESSSGPISIGADAAAEAVNIATGAAARVITVGNAASASLAMEAGVGGATLNADTTIALDAGGALAGAIVIDASNAAGGIDIDAGTGGIAINTDGALTIIPVGTGDLTTADSTGTGAGAATAALTLSTGTKIVDDNAGSPASGALTINTGHTDCTDGAGTGGDTGALIIQTGDADSAAGGSGSSGNLTIETGFSDDVASGALNLVTGNAGTDSGDVTIDVGAAGGTPGDVIIGTTATLIALDGLVKFRNAGGADAAAALLGGVGTYASPATTAVAGSNMFEFRTQTTATADDFRGFRLDADFAGVGVSGDAIRGRGLVTAAGTAGTVDGGAFTLEYNGGQVAGQGTGLRGNLVLPNAALAGGTVYGTIAEIYAGGANSDAGGATKHAILGVLSTGDGTGADRTLNAVEFLGNTDGSGYMIYSHNHAEGNAEGSIRVLINGTPRFLKFWAAE